MTVNLTVQLPQRDAPLAQAISIAEGRVPMERGHPGANIALFLLIVGFLSALLTERDRSSLAVG